MRSRGGFVSVLVLAVGLGLFLPEPETALADARAADGLSTASGRDPGGCRLQKAKAFLKRSNFVRAGQLRGREHQRAVRYRATTYGHVPGLELEAYNSDSVERYAQGTRFMGLPVQLHQKVVPALRCVERRIRASCNKRAARYTPHAVGGFRQSNTYRGGEVSNHLFGIAMDIDPEQNPCCGCVDPWPTHPLCKKETRSVFEKTALPRCWVEAFERYGFHWLGRDELQDTMHFEFLGDPDRIRP